MKTWFIFALVASGLYFILTAIFPSIYAPAVTALRVRRSKKSSQMTALVEKLTSALVPRMDIDPIKRSELEDALQGLNYTTTPEYFRAHALAKGVVYAIPALILLPLSVPISIVVYVSITILLYQRAEKSLKQEISTRRDKIERELPQLASTIRQNLNSTHDVVAILESYHKICGKTLRSEIERTLNEMKTGNPERALRAFESRVSSAPLSELVRGLIGVMRGDDRRVYFDMLAVQYQKAANEAIARELQMRPHKLYPYFGLLFVCLVSIIGIALGFYLMQQMQILFG